MKYHSFLISTISDSNHFFREKNKSDGNKTWPLLHKGFLKKTRRNLSLFLTMHIDWLQSRYNPQNSPSNRNAMLSRKRMEYPHFSHIIAWYYGCCKFVAKKQKNRFAVAFWSTNFMARLVREQKMYDKYKLQEKCVLPFLQLGVVFCLYFCAKFTVIN